MVTCLPQLINISAIPSTSPALLARLPPALPSPILLVSCSWRSARVWSVEADIWFLVWFLTNKTPPTTTIAASSSTKCPASCSRITASWADLLTPVTTISFRRDADDYLMMTMRWTTFSRRFLDAQIVQDWSYFLTNSFLNFFKMKFPDSELLSCLAKQIYALVRPNIETRSQDYIKIFSPPPFFLLQICNQNCTMILRFAFLASEKVPQVYGEEIQCGCDLWRTRVASSLWVMGIRLVTTGFPSLNAGRKKENRNSVWTAL